MSRTEEIKSEIEKLEDEIFSENMKDLGWSYFYVSERKAKIKKLKKELADLEGK